MVLRFVLCTAMYKAQASRVCTPCQSSHNSHTQLVCATDLQKLVGVEMCHLRFFQSILEQVAPPDAKRGPGDSGPVILCVGQLQLTLDLQLLDHHGATQRSAALKEISTHNDT